MRRLLFAVISACAVLCPAGVFADTSASQQSDSEVAAIVAEARQSSDRHRIFDLIEQLRERGRSAHDAVPYLEALIKTGHYGDDEDNVVTVALWALSEIDPTNKVAINEAIREIKSSFRTDDDWPLDALFECFAAGPAARQSTPLLLRYLGKLESRGSVYGQAAIVLETIGAVQGDIPSNHTDDIIAALRGTDLTRIASGLRALTGNTKSPSWQGDPSPLKLTGLDTTRRQEFVSTLLAVGSRYAAKPYFRLAVTRALGWVRPGSSEAGWRYVFDRLGDKYIEVSRAASSTIRQIGTIDTGAIGLLAANVGDGALGYLYILRQFGPQAAPAVDGIIAVLNRAVAANNDADIQNAGRLLADIGPAAARAEPSIVRAIECFHSAYDRYPLFLALSRVGPKPEDMPVILQGLKTPGKSDDYDRVFVSSALAAAALGRDGAPAIPIILELLERMDRLQYDTDYTDADFDISAYMPRHSLRALTPFTLRLELIRALGEFGPVASDTVPDLTKYAEAPIKTPYDAKVASAARDALAKIRGVAASGAKPE